jgi:hypothetical protein
LILETFFQGHEEVGYAFVTQYMHDLFPRLVDLIVSVCGGAN